MRLSALPVALALGLSSLAAHAVTISVTAVPTFTVNANGDSMSFSASGPTTVNNGGVFTQQGNFMTGPATPGTVMTSFVDSFTVGSLTEALTFSVTDVAGTFTVAGQTDTFGTTVLTFDSVSEAVNETVAANMDTSNPFLLNAHVATPPAVTPEPSSVALLGTGLLGLAGVARRRFKR